MTSFLDARGQTFARGFMCYSKGVLFARLVSRCSRGSSFCRQVATPFCLFLWLSDVVNGVTIQTMSQNKKTIPQKRQDSEVVRIRVSGSKYAFLSALAKKEKRKISNLVQVLIEEGIEKRGYKA